MRTLTDGSAHLSAASINRHLATLRSVTKLGRMLGLMTWYLEVPDVKAERRRQTAGPTVADVRAMLAATSGESDAETRDAAIVLTFYCLGLRVSELCGPRLEDTDLARSSTWILGKERRERELVPLPATVVAAIQRYLPFRGTGAGPLFQTRGLPRQAPQRRTRHAQCVADCAITWTAGRAPRLVPRPAAYVHALVCPANFMPPIFGKIVRTGRHRGIDLLWTAQRASEVSRTVTSATDFWIFYSQTEPRDLDAIAERCGREVADKVAGLGLHDSFCWHVIERKVIPHSPRLLKRGLTRSRERTEDSTNENHESGGLWNSKS